MAEQLSEALAAALGGSFSKGVLYPMDIIKNNLQAVKAVRPLFASDTPLVRWLRALDACSQGSPKKLTQMGVAKELVSTYGVTGLYCGWYWAMLSGFVEKGLYFFFYAWVKTGWTTFVGDFNVAGELIVGYLAEWTHTPFVQPIDAMLIATQTDSTKDPVTGREPIKRGNVARARAILKAKGIGGFYKGWGSYLLLALKPAIQYYTFNVCKAIVLSRGAARSAPLLPPISRCSPAVLTLGFSQRRADGLLTAAEAFIFGAVGRAVATIITFPGQRANVMAKAGGGDNSKGLVSMLLEVYRKDGIGPLYSGMQVGGHPR